MVSEDVVVSDAVLREARAGLRVAAGVQKTLTPWLFYDDAGSRLFEEITALPEYYLTRTERGLFVDHAAEILEVAADGQRLTLLELGAGSAAKTGVLLEAAVRRQGTVRYQPIDVSASALEEAAASIAERIPGVVVESQVANYITEGFTLARAEKERVLAMYIGSSIGNFSRREAMGILRNLREHLEPRDGFLLGADLAPFSGASGTGKSVESLLAAYDDAAGVTAAFNKNVLVRLNRELGADFELEAFAHRARWNAADSRIEMHLESLVTQTVTLGETGMRVEFAAGETIHTENSYKFSRAGIEALLRGAGFAVERVWMDVEKKFAVTLARAV